MEVFRHHIYEYRKGLRGLVLYTGKSELRHEIVKKLEEYNISYLVSNVSEDKINVFFGDPECVSIVKSFGDKPLYEFTDEEDFILGIMLGYCRKQQCKRYIKRKEQKSKITAEKEDLHCEKIAQ